MNLALVGLVVLQIRGHRVTAARLLVPVVLTVWACSQFLHALPTAGNDLVLELTLALTGIGLGIAAAVLWAVAHPARTGPGQPGRRARPAGAAAWGGSGGWRAGRSMRPTRRIAALAPCRLQPRFHTLGGDGPSSPLSRDGRRAEGGHMYTRLLTFKGASDLDGGVAYLREEALPVLTAQHGYRGVTASGNPSTRIFGILSLWDTEQDRASSDSALGKAREEAVKVVGGTLTIENLEQLVAEVVNPITVGCSLFITRVSMDPAKIDDNVAFFKSDVLPVIKSQPGFCALRNMIDRNTGKGVVGSVWETQDALDAFVAMQPERRKIAEGRGVRFDEQETRKVLFADIK
jgi:heme-degrading monooxygenase HmoA